MLFIGTPLYDNRVHTEYMKGLIDTISLFQSKGLGVQYVLERGTFIAVNREKLIRRFLETDCQFFMFIDADTDFAPLDILALLGADVDVVSGLYRFRMPVAPGAVDHCFCTTEGKPVEIFHRGSEKLQECGFLPTGMMLIRRSVIERMYTKHQFLFDQGFRDTQWFKTLYGHEAENGDDISLNFEGDDVHFSRLWREMGGKLHVMTGVQVGHVGTMVYRPNPTFPLYA